MEHSGLVRSLAARAAMVAAAWVLLVGAQAAPVCFWASEPVRPGETALLYGEGFGEVAAVTVERLADAAGPAEGGVAEVLNPCARSLKAVLPAGLRQGLYRLTVTDAQGEALEKVLNRPKVLWTQGDAGGYGTPGGTLRAVGNCLAAPGAEPRMRLARGGEVVELAARRAGGDADEFCVAASLPEGIAEGEWQLEVSNGYGGEAGWSEPVAARVGTPDWPEAEFAVTAYGADGTDEADDTRAVTLALEAAGEAGGGVVRLPAGRLLVHGQITVPQFVTLRGEGMGATVVAWADTETPPPAQVKGSDHFRLQDLTLYCSNYTHVIVADLWGDQAGTVTVERVRVRANIYNYHRTEEEVDKRFRDSLKLSTGGGDTLQLGGRDVVVRDCDLVGSGRCLFLRGGQGALISGNRFLNGRWGWYCISGSDGVIFEDNVIQGGDLMSTGGGLNCLDGSNCSQNIYYARNRLGNMFGWDREAMTSDAGGGAYAGLVATADAQSLTCATEPAWGGKDWRGAAVFVMDGRGMGQYRRIADYQGSRVQVDRPWDVPPDETSTITITMLQRNYLLVENSFEDAGVAIQFFGTSVDHICAGNTTARTGGFHNLGLDYVGKQPTWFVQWLGNRITEGNVFTVEGSGTAHLATYSMPPGDWRHPLALGSVMRRNVLENGARIEVGPGNPGTPLWMREATQTALVEGNTVRNSPMGITALSGVPDVTLRANQFENVEMPLVDEAELDRRAAVRRAELAARREPIMHLSFDEVKDGYVVDQSGMGFGGECDATVDLSQEGVKGTCATFDGKSRIVVPRGRDLDLDTVTVSAWVKPANLDGRYGLISKRTGNNGAPYIVTMNGATLGFEATDSGGAWSFNFGAQGVIQAGVWQHVAAVLQYGVGVRLYVNGREVGRLDNPASVCRNGQGLTLGWEAWGGPQVRADAVGYYFGSLDEVKVWARVLSEEEIAAEAVR